MSDVIVTGPGRYEQRDGSIATDARGTELTDWDRQRHGATTDRSGETAPRTTHQTTTLCGDWTATRRPDASCTK
jgi:hypothetical protein